MFRLKPIRAEQFDKNLKPYPKWVCDCDLDDPHVHNPVMSNMWQVLPDKAWAVWTSENQFKVMSDDDFSYLYERI